MVEYLKYGATGLVAIIILAVMVPVIRAFIEELKESRRERQDMRREHNEFIINHARHTTDALLQVKDGLEQVCRRLNGDKQ
jgi:uncharacterized membrane protein YcjF (UPF0283 family)